jgi:hypothetical protein
METIYSENFEYIYIDVHSERHSHFGCLKGNIFEKYFTVYHQMSYIAISRADFLKYFKVLEEEKGTVRAIKMRLRSGKNPVNPRKHQEKDQESLLPPKNLNQPKKPDPLNLNEQDEFDKLYKDLSRPGAFTYKIKLYLRRNQTHSLHRPKRKIFPRRKIVTHYPGHIVQSDLINMQKFSANNSGYSYILVVIDCLSKYLWC